MFRRKLEPSGVFLLSYLAMLVVFGLAVAYWL
jgi:hypothetical protein